MLILQGRRVEDLFFALFSSLSASKHLPIIQPGRRYKCNTSLKTTTTTTTKKNPNKHSIFTRFILFINVHIYCKHHPISVYIWLMYVKFHPFALRYHMLIRFEIEKAWMFEHLTFRILREHSTAELISSMKQTPISSSIY